MGIRLQRQGQATVRRTRTSRLLDAEYAIAVNADIRDLDVSFIDEPDERVNALGAKGVGEVVSVGAIAAIANAIHHATGKRVRHFPIRADDLLA